MKRFCALLRAFSLALSCLIFFLASSREWFGHIRFGTPLVHTDDHRALTRASIDYLIRSGRISRSSKVASFRSTIERYSGLLDIMESEVGGKVPGKLKWDFSHMYDPITKRGMNDKRFMNAMDEFCDFWGRSLVHLRIGNFEKAFLFLGFSCHLLEDMTVPAHTFCIPHGIRVRIADNFELLSRPKKFYVRDHGDPGIGKKGTHIKLFISAGLESRGRDSLNPQDENEISIVLKRYYSPPKWSKGGWSGKYIGEPYYPYHRLLPSSPRIKLSDFITLRNYLEPIAIACTAQLIEHFAMITNTYK